MFNWRKEKQTRDDNERYERAQLRDAISGLAKQIWELNHDMRILHETIAETHSTYLALLAQMQKK